jgi:hypothetical protein
MGRKTKTELLMRRAASRRAARKRRRSARRAEPAAGGESFHLPLAGLGGQHQELLVQFRFVDGDPRNDIPVEGGLGRYLVVFTFARPGQLPRAETDFSFDENIEGDSHVAIGSPALTLRHGTGHITALEIHAETEQGAIVFTAFPNPRGFLARITAEVEAVSFVDAKHRAYRALAPSLSRWSASLDCPVHIWRTWIRNPETGSVQISVTNPYREAAVPLVGEGEVSQDFRSLASLYREGLESASSVYQFLCLFKIAEAIRNRRSRLAVNAKSQGQELPMRPPERVPSDPQAFQPWLNAIFLPPRVWDEMSLDSIFVVEARNRKFNDLLDRELTDLRNDIAHALSTDTGEITHSADEALHVVRVDKWLPFLRCMVRRMLKNDFPREYLPQLQEDGTLRGQK